MGAPGATRWIPRLQGWASRDPNVRIVLLVGSQARRDTPADALSDIDLALFTRDPDAILQDEAWIGRLGEYWTSHLEPNALENGEERRVLFADGQDVDFAVFPLSLLGSLTKDPRGAAVLRRGFRVLVNKEEVEVAVPGDETHPLPPTSAEFSNLVNDYWFHLVWTAKKLRRGERLVALEATNGYLRAMLLRTVRWHAVACGPKSVDVWHGSRFFEQWADPRAVRAFPDTVALYEDRSIARALDADRTLFGWLTAELARALSLEAPIRDPAGLSSYLDGLLREPSP